MFQMVKFPYLPYNNFKQRGGEFMNDDIFPTELCWQTGNYTDECCCEFCEHSDECSGSEDKD